MASIMTPTVMFRTAACVGIELMDLKPSAGPTCCGLPPSPNNPSGLLERAEPDNSKRASGLEELTCYSFKVSEGWILIRLNIQCRVFNNVMS